MKKILIIIAASMLMSEILNAQDIKIMSYNIRHSEAKDGTNSWIYRYAAVGDMIIDQKADVLGLQEAREDQIRFIEENFKDYKGVGENTAIFWNKKTVSMQKSGSFESASWALMKDKATGKSFYVVNTDLDQVAKEERKVAVRHILDKIGEINTKNLPVVFLGGFYMKSSDSGLTEVESGMKNARKTAEKTDNTGTYHNWGKTSETIDHIYYSGFVSCAEYQTVTKKYDNRKFVSDHYPLTVELVF